MATTTAQPVDLQLIGIIHDALRCDLGRSFDTLSTRTPLGAHRRAALAEHLTWTLAFLERHHTTEEAYLWAPARQRSPSAVPLIRQLTTGHARIHHAAGAVVHASSCRLPDTPEVRDDLRGALERLCIILLPHLDREETELGPILAATITNTEWSAWHRQLFHTTGPSEFARENHWLNETRILTPILEVARQTFWIRSQDSAPCDSNGTSPSTH